MNIAEFGATIKQKYPQYKDLPDEEIGNRMLTKYPQYKDMVTVAPVVTQPKEPSTLEKAVNYALPKTFEAGKVIANTPQVWSKASEELKQNGPFAAPSPELRKLTGGSSTDTGNRFLNAAMDAWNRTQTSTRAGAEIGSLVSWIKSIPSGIKNLLHPIKNTGSKLETIRSAVKVEPTDVDSGILRNLKDNPAQPKYFRTYNLGGKNFQKTVDSTVETIAKKSESLDDVYKNLEAIKDSLPKDVYGVVNGAMRDYANPLQTQAGIKLAETYSRLKGLQKYEGTVKKALIGTGSAAVIWTLRGKIAKLLGL